MSTAEAMETDSAAVSVPWTEKYRPKSVDDVSHQDEVVSMLKSCLNSGSLPHLLFYGPPGTGKTSTILAITKDMFGDLYKKRVLELNASDERGISVVRDKIKTFAKGAIGSSGSAPPFKVIILDEADAMTPDAQSALRRTMEEYSSVTRFCMVCNYVSRIIEPLASRCAKFRFKPLPQAAIVDRLRMICENESLTFDTTVLDVVNDVSGGDLRKAITFVQGASRLSGGSVSAQTVIDMAGAVPQDEVKALVDTLRCERYEAMEAKVRDITQSGFSAHAVLSQMLKAIVQDSELSDMHKAKASIKLAEVEKKLIDGASEQLQLLHACSYIQCVICNKRPLPGEVA
jgi:replication factor C subunit 2/4